MRPDALSWCCASLLAWGALAQTDVVVSIAPAGTPGAAYNSLVTWEAGEEDDLVALNQNHIAEISGSWTVVDLGPVLVDGWTTDGTRFVTIRAVGAARHQGVFPASGSGKHVLTINPTDTIVLDLWESFTVLDGLSLLLNSQNNISKAVQGNSTSGANAFTFRSCLAKNSNKTPTSQAGFSLSHVANVNDYLVNCVADGFDNGFIISQYALGVFVNCTAVNSTLVGFTVQGGYENSAMPTFINCVSTLSSNSGFYYGLLGGLSDYNISDQAQTMPGPNSKVGTVLLVDTVNGDYHLSASDAQARAFCPHYNGAAGITFTNDFEGNERGATTWDAGADEYGSSAPVTARGQVIMVTQ